MTLFSTPVWLQRMLMVMWPGYLRHWAELDQRSGVTGIAREERVLFRFGTYRLVVNRESRKKENSDAE